MAGFHLEIIIFKVSFETKAKMKLLQILIASVLSMALVSQCQEEIE